MKKRTEAEQSMDRTMEHWHQAGRPSRVLIIVSLACFVGFLIMTALWVNEYAGTAPPPYQTKYEHMLEVDAVKNEAIQLLMLELGWPVIYDEWWDYCRGRLGLEKP